MKRMTFHLSKAAVLVLAVCLWEACAPAKVVIDYSTVSVGEEGGNKFLQYTKDEDLVIQPSISKRTLDNGLVVLDWFPAKNLSISDDGMLIAYLATVNGTTNIYIKKTQGGASTMQRTFRSSVNDLSLSPDGRFIAFSDKSEGNLNIYQMNATEGSAITQITSSNGQEDSPCYSTDGDLIYFTKTEYTVTKETVVPKYAIWSFDRANSLLTQYTEGYTPTTTPDGNHILVTRNNKNTNNREIWMIDTQRGSETLLLSDPNRSFTSPHVSPDGLRVVCVGSTKMSADGRPSNLDIWSFNIDGTNLTQLTYHNGHDLEPKWSPDGDHIYFLSQRGSSGGRFNIWRMEYNYLKAN